MATVSVDSRSIVWSRVVVGTRRWARQDPFLIPLGLLWLLDGALQFQPFMFTSGFVNGILAPGAQGNPHIVAAPITAVARVLLGHFALWNFGFAVTQVVIGLGILWPRIRRPALVISIVWALGVWWFGEGLGGVLTGAPPTMGLPGAVVLYALLAVLLWPSPAGQSSPADEVRSLAPAQRGPLGPGVPLVLWSLLWLSFAYFALLAENRSPEAWYQMVIGMSGPEPGWVTHMNAFLGRVVQDRGLQFAAAMAVLCALVGLGVYVSRFRRATVMLAGAVAAAIWVIEDFGGILTGRGTDPNSGAVLVLLAATFWPPSRSGSNRGAAPTPPVAKGRDPGLLVDWQAGPVPRSPTPPWVVWGSIVLCLAGLGVDIYLTVQHYLSSVVPLVCSDKGVINCAKVLSSQWSKLFGIPLTDLGVAYFVGMLVLCSPWAWRRTDPVVRWLRMLGVVVSMLMVLYLFHAEVADIHAICLFCTATHVVAFLLFVVVLTGDAFIRADLAEAAEPAEVAP